ncbi:MAG: site-2 protease family protein, partial [Anaerolineae bacterium]
FLTGWLLAILLFLTGFPVIDEMRIAITGVAENSPAAAAGLQEGDYIESVAGQTIEEITEISQITDENLGKSMTITVSRDGERETVTLVPRDDPPEGEGAMGVRIESDPIYHIEKLALPQAVVRGTGTFFELVGQILMLPVTIIRGIIPLEMARPAGIITTSRLAYASIQESIKQGTLIPIFELLIVVSASLAIFNLLPIPILDGGHILFTVIEMIKGEPIKPSLKERIYQVALIFLALLFVATIALDLLFPIF